MILIGWYRLNVSAAGEIVEAASSESLHGSLQLISNRMVAVFKSDWENVLVAKLLTCGNIVCICGRQYFLVVAATSTIQV